MPNNGKDKPSGGYGVQPRYVFQFFVWPSTSNFFFDARSPKSEFSNLSKQTHHSSTYSKLFIGGLSFDTTDDKLRAFFKKYGAVSDAVVMRDPSTRRSRGFGFVTFADSSSADAAMSAAEHIIDGRRVEAKRAVPREDNSRDAPVQTVVSAPARKSKPSSSSTSSGNHVARSGVPCKKIFVGGLHYETCDETLKKYFRTFGVVETVQVMYNRETNKSRGFGFVTFETEAAVDKVLQNRMHNIDNKSVEVKRAVPKADAPPATKFIHSNSSSSSSATSRTGGGSSRGRSTGTSSSSSSNTRSSRGNTRSSSRATKTTSTKPVVPVKNAWSVPLANAWGKGNAAQKLQGKTVKSTTKSSNVATTTKVTKEPTFVGEEKKVVIDSTAPTPSTSSSSNGGENKKDGSPIKNVRSEDMTTSTGGGVTTSRMAFAKTDAPVPMQQMFGGSQQQAPMPPQQQQQQAFPSNMWLGFGGPSNTSQPPRQSNLMRTFNSNNNNNNDGKTPSSSSDDPMVSRMQALNFSSSRAPGTYGNNMPPPRHPFGMFGRGPMQQNPYPYGMGGFTPSPQPQQPQQTGFGAGWGRNHFGAQQGSPRPAPHQYGQHPPQPYMSNMFMGGFNGARPQQHHMAPPMPTTSVPTSSQPSQQQHIPDVAP